MSMKRQNKNILGFSLVELMVVILILTSMMGGVYLSLRTGSDSWCSVDSQMQINDNLRLMVEKISKELRETGYDLNGVAQFTIYNGTGVGGSDILRFSMPVQCSSNSTVLDVNGNVAYWRAPLTWGCYASSCMDADNDCSTVDYRYVEYSLDNSRRLVRKVLNNVASVVRTDIFAQNIADFQATLSADTKVITISATSTINGNFKRNFSGTKTMAVYLRNRGS